MKHDHWPEPLSGPLPECFSSLQEAFEEYASEKENGFDGNYTEFLDMKRHGIDLGYAEREFEGGAKQLLKLSPQRLRLLCAKWMDAAS
jgi:hypothetical protein